MRFILMEAIHSCVLEHRAGCKCSVCRAADGDQDALAEVIAGVMLGGADVLASRQSLPPAEKEQNA